MKFYEILILLFCLFSLPEINAAELANNLELTDQEILENIISSIESNDLATFQVVVGNYSVEKIKQIINNFDYLGSNPLSVAVTFMNFAIVQRLLTLGANLDLKDDYDQSTPLIRSIISNQNCDENGNKITSLLINKKKQKIKDDIKNYLITMRDGEKQFQNFINAEDNTGNNALVHATIIGNIDIIKLLIKEGAELSAGIIAEIIRYGIFNKIFTCEFLLSLEPNIYNNVMSILNKQFDVLSEEDEKIGKYLKRIRETILHRIKSKKRIAKMKQENLFKTISNRQNAVRMPYVN